MSVLLRLRIWMLRRKANRLRDQALLLVADARDLRDRANVLDGDADELAGRDPRSPRPP